MMRRSAFAYARISLPSKGQVQSERERLKQIEYRWSKVLRWSALVLFLCLLITSLVAFCFPVVRVADDAMQPALRQGDIVLLYRTKRIDDGDICALHANDSFELLHADDLLDTASAEMKHNEKMQVFGRAVLRIGSKFQIELF